MIYNLTAMRYLYHVNGKAYMNACMCAKHTSTYDTNFLLRIGAQAGLPGQ